MFYLKKDPLIIRKISGLKEKKIFLTFDDGPEPEFTPQVLDLLLDLQWKATFFVIGEKAEKNKILIQRMIDEGHAIMCHSFDHASFSYFRGSEFIQNWVKSSLDHLSQITNQSQVAFRPPAGVINPPLVKAARILKTPLVLWNVRFYDTQTDWTKKKVQHHLNKITTGDIVLLHDRQAPQRQIGFLENLRFYIVEMKQRGFSSGKLSNQLLLAEIENQKTPPNNLI